MPRLNPRQISSLAKAVGNTKLSIGVREQKLKELEKLVSSNLNASQQEFDTAIKAIDNQLELFEENFNNGFNSFTTSTDDDAVDELMAQIQDEVRLEQKSKAEIESKENALIERLSAIKGNLSSLPTTTKSQVAQTSTPKKSAHDPDTELRQRLNDLREIPTAEELRQRLDNLKGNTSDANTKKSGKEQAATSTSSLKQSAKELDEDEQANQIIQLIQDEIRLEEMVFPSKNTQTDDLAEFEAELENTMSDINVNIDDIDDQQLEQELAELLASDDEKLKEHIIEPPQIVEPQKPKSAAEVAPIVAATRQNNKSSVPISPVEPEKSGLFNFLQKIVETIGKAISNALGNLFGSKKNSSPVEPILTRPETEKTVSVPQTEKTITPTKDQNTISSKGNTSQSSIPKRQDWHTPSKNNGNSAEIHQKLVDAQKVMKSVEDKLSDIKELQHSYKERMEVRKAALQERKEALLDKQEARRPKSNH